MKNYTYIANIYKIWVLTSRGSIFVSYIAYSINVISGHKTIYWMYVTFCVVKYKFPDYCSRWYDMIYNIWYMILYIYIYMCVCVCVCVCVYGPGSVVGITTAYGLDGRGIESLWGEIFRICPDRPWGSLRASCTMGTGPFPGVRCGRGVTLTPHPLLVQRSKIE